MCILIIACLSLRNLPNKARTRLLKLGAFCLLGITSTGRDKAAQVSEEA